MLFRIYFNAFQCILMHLEIQYLIDNVYNIYIYVKYIDKCSKHKASECFIFSLLDFDSIKQ